MNKSNGAISAPLQRLVIPFLDSVICGDAVDIMFQLPECSVDALITDPPYCAGSISEASRVAAKGQGLRSKNIRRFGWFIGDNMGTAGLAFLLRSIAFEATRVLKPTGSVLVFCDWRMVPTLIPAVESAGLRYQNLIVWDKGHMGLGAGFRARHELIMHMTVGSPEYHDKGTANVLTAKRVNADDKEHQTQKPTSLLRQLIEVVTPPGGIVLDPFAGSGSTLVAARETGRHWIGIERNPDHCQTSRRRVESMLFGG